MVAAVPKERHGIIRRLAATNGPRGVGNHVAATPRAHQELLKAEKHVAVAPGISLQLVESLQFTCLAEGFVNALSHASTPDLSNDPKPWDQQLFARLCPLRNGLDSDICSEVCIGELAEHTPPLSFIAAFTWIGISGTTALQVTNFCNDHASFATKGEGACFATFLLSVAANAHVLSTKFETTAVQPLLELAKCRLVGAQVTAKHDLDRSQGLAVRRIRQVCFHQVSRLDGAILIRWVHAIRGHADHRAEGPVLKSKLDHCNKSGVYPVKYPMADISREERAEVE
mmetsp:Transcript_81913/g.147865  ORF Transcript_81913/g.147865 Transcript_81913/m.147865 type:complete len:285 (-) Transcript_81913:325-1179(-)